MLLARGVLAAPPTTGLVASAGRLDIDDPHWVQGFAWIPERCGATYQLLPFCSEDDPPALDPERSGAVYHMPTVARFASTCSTMGGGIDPERIRRLVEATTPFAVARELWTGEAGREPFDTGLGTAANNWLAHPDAEVVGAAADPLAAIGALEAAALEASRGQRIMLHIPVVVLPRVGEHFRRVGPDFLTRLDNPVIADAGYPGTGPVGAGTSEVQTVTITGGPTGGSFTLGFDGQTTASIAHNATASAVAAALNALPNLSGVAGGGGPLPGTAVTVTFDPDQGDVSQMTATSSLTGGTTPAVAVTTTTPGVGPAPAAGLWAYATSMVQVGIGRASYITDPESTVDRAVNSVTHWGERPIAAVFDPCVHFAHEITIGS